MLDNHIARPIKIEKTICEKCNGQKHIEISSLDLLDKIMNINIDTAKKIYGYWIRTGCIICNECDGLGYIETRM